MRRYSVQSEERETQTFGYDHLHRLTSASAGGYAGGPTSYNRTYSYDLIGNLKSKDGRNYTYPASGATSVRPHAVTCADWSGSVCAANETYSYDGNGNLVTGGGRSFTWTAENQPKSVTQSGVTESYLYNADNERVSKTSNGTTTYYFGGGMAEETGTTKRHAYTFNGQTIGERDVPAGAGTSTFRYLHGDHLGSVSAVSTSNATPTVTRQSFTPWGEARHGSLTATTERNYTGQRKDSTGLLFYNARYYDAKLGRFLSADSIVPGMASGKGGMGRIGADSSTASTLTVDFHEPGFAAEVGSENTFISENGFQFETNEQGKYQGGPPNPQALNRYSYVLNNPLRYVDPTGHVPCICTQIGKIARAFVRVLAGYLTNKIGRALLRSAGGELTLLVADLGIEAIQQFRSSADKLYRGQKKGGWKIGGRALQKHSSRPGSVWAGPTGRSPDDYNKLANKYIDEILSNPNAIVKVVETNRPGWGGWQTDIYLPGGGGIRFDAFNNFMGFLEPLR